MPYEPGHTTNVGTTYQAAKTKRVMKRRAYEAKIEAMLPEELRKKPKRDYTKDTERLLANRFTGATIQKGVGLPGAGRPKRTPSIKQRLLFELNRSTNADSLAIARRLINMAKAGDLKAIELVMDRVDGKVPTTIAGDKNNPLVITVEPILASKYSKEQPKHVNTIPVANLPGPTPLPSDKLRKEVREDGVISQGDKGQSSLPTK